KIAIIGPNAKIARISGGGSALVNAHYRVAPYDGIAAVAGDQVQLGFELGATNHKYLPLIAASAVAPRGREGEEGFLVSYFNSLDLSGQPAHERIETNTEQCWLGGVAPGIHPRQFSARFATTFTPNEPGL